jgi:acetylornithine/succinyldiaminopimelate/putrescine aminotransferase
MLHARAVFVTAATGHGALTDSAIALDEHCTAHNYSPLPVVAASAEGAWIVDVEGRRYLDCLAAYSAVNFGHRNPEITATAHAQLDLVTLVSRPSTPRRSDGSAQRWRRCATRTWCCR